MLIGEDFTFTLAFTNPGTAPNPDGYGPYIDLFLPLGADGDDGVTIAPSGAITYLGTSVNYQLITIGAGGTADHPYFRNTANQPGVISGQPGQMVVVIELPFGSYTSGQPAAELVVNASLSSLADHGTGLVRRQRLPEHQLGQRGAGDLLGDHVAQPVVRADVEHPEQPGVGDQRGTAGGVQARAGRLGGEHLRADRPVEDLVDRRPRLQDRDGRLLRLEHAVAPGEQRPSSDLVHAQLPHRRQARPAAAAPRAAWTR